VRPVGQLYCEDDPVHPLNYYGMSKAQAELVVQEECQTPAPWTICRTAVIYGGPSWSRPDFTQWLRAKVRQRELLRLATDQISSPTYAVDLARALVTLVHERVQGTYHIAGGTPIDRYHFALAIAQVYDFDPELLQPVPTSKLALVHPRPLNVGLSIDKVSSILGYAPRPLADDLMAWREQECVEQDIVF
jgi:dTDP-4-dehydrorhamnose reductase